MVSSAMWKNHALVSFSNKTKIVRFRGNKTKIKPKFIQFACPWPTDITCNSTNCII
jgi:hypothetical protein